MRIDRLLSVLLFLQRRGQVTAAEVAEEMEVSERTARRDLEALLMAGVPVYSVRGRGGGWRLVGGARTDLTGLTADEARALFLVAGPATEVTPAVRAALRKLVQALPEPLRDQAESAASSLVVDPRHWTDDWSQRERPQQRQQHEQDQRTGPRVQQYAVQAVAEMARLGSLVYRSLRNGARFQPPFGGVHDGAIGMRTDLRACIGDGTFQIV